MEPLRQRPVMQTDYDVADYVFALEGDILACHGTVEGIRAAAQRLGLLDRTPPALEAKEEPHAPAS